MRSKRFVTASLVLLWPRRRPERAGWTEPQRGCRYAPTACDLYVTYGSEKWSERLDSNQRALRPRPSRGQEEQAVLNLAGILSY